MACVIGFRRNTIQLSPSGLAPFIILKLIVASDGLLLKIHHDFVLSFIEHRFSEIPDGEAVENMMSVIIEYPQIV